LTKGSSKDKEQRNLKRLSLDIAISSIAGLLAFSASVLELLNLGNWVNSPYGKLLVGFFAGIAGVLLGFRFYSAKEGKGDE
jgi:hypothetical protein